MRINAIDDDININWSLGLALSTLHLFGGPLNQLNGTAADPGVAPIYANGNPASKYALYCASFGDICRNG